ncbi:MAG TPA: cytochrome C [Bacteroidetes bacterium]|nr:cytochrome C [Bacteroidota bacterium]HRR07399.1 cytochrome c3 family protein [Rhodothermales bacterium]
MAQVFSKASNRLPLIALVGGLGFLLFTIWFISYYFSPKYTDVGYAPKQPVPYSHQFHAGELGMDCRYCHSNVENGAIANLPATQTCMNCHNQVKPESVKLLPVRESWASGKPIEWVKVHMLPEYAHFNHSVHVNAGSKGGLAVGCETCHGRVDEMEVVSQVQPLSMSWCLECHATPEKYLRPAELITKMGYDQSRPADQEAKNLEVIKKKGIAPPTNCSACHY